MTLGATRRWSDKALLSHKSEEKKIGDVYVVAQPRLYGKSWQRVFTFPCLLESRLSAHRIRSLHVGDGSIVISQPYLQNG